MQNKHKKSGNLIVVVLVSCLIFGFVLGAVVIHLVDRSKIKKLEESLELSRENQKNIEVVDVYVPKRDVMYGKIPVNSYNPNNFKIQDGYMAYLDDEGNKISHIGIDLSYHNAEVDWDELAESGVEFVMLRCGYRGYTEGGLVTDEKFREYASEANRVGINLGVYFFTQAIDEQEAIDEADYVIDLIRDYDISYPVALDCEYVDDDSARTNVNEISDELRSKMAVLFCERLKEEGYYPMIYASENWIRRYMDVEMLKEYDLWAPQYTEECDYMYDFTIWQYSERGYVPGVEGQVDMDISMVDYASFVPSMRKSVETDGKIVEFPPLE